MFTRAPAVLMVLSLPVAGFVARSYADGFTASSCWATYDPGENGVGADPRGYTGGVFDGGYVYFAPFRRHDDLAIGLHGEVLRYDTQAGFDVPASWATYDYGADPLGCAQDPDCNDPDGYSGVVFDGKYVYFVPYHNGTEFYGEVLRYDTQEGFDDPASWATYDYGADPLGCTLDPECNDPDGYGGAVFDGRYVYFVPHFNGLDYHGEVMRYDTQGQFDEPLSWDTYAYGEHCIPGVDCTDPRGYIGAVFDGRYVYLAPTRWYSDAEQHGEVLRYDTEGDFKDSDSWTTYDYGADPLGCTQDPECNDPDGYEGAVFDGQQYIYFVPFHNGIEHHGLVLRYDIQGPFDSAESWATYDPGPDGFDFAAFDGRFIYFAPYHREHPDGEVLRFDTAGDFTEASSWATYDYGEHCAPPNCDDPDGYVNVVVNGRYVYFVPYNNGTEWHGEVLRYDTACGASIPTVSEWGMVAMTLLVLTACTLVFMRQRPVEV